MHNLIIYGGTFDPIHLGHLNTAINVQKYFCFERLLFLPCKVPVLKSKAVASAQHRVAMIELALETLDKQHFGIDLSEINRITPSYMIDTLKDFRQRFGEYFSITLLLGKDTFNQLPQWRDWKKLLDFANFLVIERAGVKEAKTPSSVQALLNQYETQDKKALSQQPHGLIACFDAGSFNFSSSEIRKLLISSKDGSAYLPQAIEQYIRQNNLYSH